MNIGENLARLRKDKQISVYKSVPSIEILTALLSPLGMRLSEFFNEESEKSNILYPSPCEAELVRLYRQLNKEQAGVLLNLAKLLAQK